MPAMGLSQKAGTNNTIKNLNTLITNEIDNSTSSSSDLVTARSLAAAQVANAIHKVTPRAIVAVVDKIHS